MRLLVLDTALGACAAAVAHDGRVLCARAEPMTRGHQERLAPLVAEVMAQAGVAFDRLDRVGVTVGPGSFTGLRVGLAFARTLALALGAPCVGAGTLQALAAGTAGEALAVIDAPQDRLYAQRFRDGQALGPPALESREAIDLRGLDRVVGPGAPRVAAGTGLEVEARGWPDPAALARLLARAPVSGPPAPLYLRGPDARTLAERGLAPRG